MQSKVSEATEIQVMGRNSTEFPIHVQQAIFQLQNENDQKVESQYTPQQATQPFTAISIICLVGALGLAVVATGGGDNRPSYQQLEQQVRSLETQLYAEQQRTNELQIRLTEAYAARGD